LAPGHPYLTRLWAKRIDSALGQQGAESQLGEFCTLGLMWGGSCGGKKPEAQLLCSASTDKAVNWSMICLILTSNPAPVHNG
jgi:hypothetical protein